MTEKRFIRNIIGQVYDTKNDKFFQEDYTGKPIGYEDDLVECLNALHEENQQIKTTINEACESERTALGKSVLKNLAQNLNIK